VKVFITGGSGFVGSFLSQELAARGHDITILTRKDPAPVGKPGIRFLSGDPTQAGAWMEAVPEHDWIINLAGASIFSRWTEEYKKTMVESRVRTTQNLVQAMAAGNRRQLFCSTSAVGYYGPRGDETLTEDSRPDGDFLADLAWVWEDQALQARELGLRVVVTRFGIVLGQNGGVLGKLTPLFKAFLGGPVGSGRQWFSWIHQKDLVRAYLYILENNHVCGPLNFTAPQPAPNWMLARDLARTLKRPDILPAPAFLIRLVMGELADVVLSSQKVLPKRLLDAGFKFAYPTLPQALADIYSTPAKSAGGG
jgi:uncharacterized protein (TIGR01777 family)